MTDRPRRRSRSGFASDRSGQASTVGTALLLVITLVGTGLIVTIGGSAIDSTQQSADISRAEHSMTMLDSRAAVVALDETDSASTRFSQPDSGSFYVEEDTGRMTIVHHNYTGNGTNQTIYDDQLGAVVYENSDTTIAYQGGGVWRSDGGASRMVSPPEFHYRGSTLTLPIIQIQGTDSARGGSTALMTSTGDAESLYPTTGSTYNETGEPYANPVANGTVTVTVEGPYYQGWAQYFRSRTDGNVTVDHDDQTATIELIAAGLGDEFDIPADPSEPIPIRGMEEGHAVEQFDVTISQDTTGNQFNEMYFSFWIDDGGRELEIMVHVPGGGGNFCDGDDLEDNLDPLEMDVYYYDSGTSEGHHAWTNDSIPADTGPVRLECDNDEPSVYIHYTGDQNLTYGNFTTNDNQWYHDRDNTTASTMNFTPSHTAQGNAPSEPSDTFGTNDAASLDLLINHYFALFGPDLDLRYNQGPGGSDPVDPLASGGTLDYYATGNSKFLTYLHISEHRIEVEFR